jgi:hypothetical protein
VRASSAYRRSGHTDRELTPYRLKPGAP